jgi:hypothetical protein
MVEVDLVYQRVLALANKEQRGYITPQEFNLFANQAQLDIFEQYFYDLNQFRRLPGNDTKYSDMVDILEEKISIFKRGPESVDSGGYLTDIDGFYKLTDVYCTKDDYDVVVEKIRYEDYQKIQTPLTKPNKHRPVYWTKGNQIYFDGVTDSDVSCNYIVKPQPINWAYVVVSGKALYNDNEASNFELHPSEEVDLVFKIAQLAGIAIKDNSLYQSASLEEGKNIQQEKQ